MNTLDDVYKILHELNPGGFNADEYGRLREELVKNAVLDYYIPLRSDRKVIGPVIVLFKRIVRRLLSNLLLPLVRQQNTFNAHVIQALDSICHTGKE